MDNPVKLVCTACSCLCDDIEIEVEGDRSKRIRNACIKGASFLYATESPERRLSCQIEGQPVSFEKAIEESARLLQRASRKLIFGLDNSTLETQAAGIKLAQAMKAVIDDNSSFCQGALVEGILGGTIPSCSLPQVRESADLLVYWGSNPYHSHPRHLARFSFYPHLQYREGSPKPEVTLSYLDVRKTELATLCEPVFKLKPGGDRDFIEAVLLAIKGAGKNEEAKAFVELVKKSRFCVMFAGLGLTYSLNGDFNLFIEMIHQLSQGRRVVVIPMVGHFNMRGFNQLLYARTGYVNKVSFAGGVSHGDEFSFLEQVRNRAADCLLIVGANPCRNLPHSLMRNLEGVPIICLDPLVNSTTRASRVAFGTAVSASETGGRAIRMDGEEVTLLKIRSSQHPSDEEILTRLLDKLSK